MNQVYYNPDKKLLVITDRQAKPVAAYGGPIAARKYAQLHRRQLPANSRTDRQNELELCRSVLLNTTDLPPDIRAEYQKRYRMAKKQLEQKENSLIKS